MIKKVFYVCFLFILFNSCTKDDGVRIDSGLRPFYDTFLEEAAVRNRVFTEEELNISVIFTDIPQQGVLGRCSRFLGEDTEVIEIDRFAWASFDEPTREFIMFHELGHCLLSRDHRDDVDSAGRCRSLMHSFLGLCEFEFVGARRDAYIDELFQ